MLPDQPQPHPMVSSVEKKKNTHTHTRYLVLLCKTRITLQLENLFGEKILEVIFPHPPEDEKKKKVSSGRDLGAYCKS